MIAPFLLALLTLVPSPNVAPPLATEDLVTPLLDLQPSYVAHCSIPAVPPANASTFRFECMVTGRVNVQVKNDTRAPVLLYTVWTTLHADLSGSTLTLPQNLGNVLPILPGQTQDRFLNYLVPFSSPTRPISEWSPDLVVSVPIHFVDHGLTLGYTDLDFKLMGYVVFE